MMENDRKIMIEEFEESTEYTKDFSDGEDYSFSLVLTADDADFLGWRVSNRVYEKYKKGELNFINDGNNYEIKQVYKFIVTRVGDECCEHDVDIRKERDK